VIGKTSFIWPLVSDEPGLNAQRGYIEREAIGWP
jgi:hypothetical protein